MHSLLQLQGTALQVMYHFTVGRALVDARVTLTSPYAGRPSLQPCEPVPAP